MVKIESGLFNEIRKSLDKQNVTFQTRKRGIVLEKKPVPTYTRTEKQDAIRTKYKQLCETWKTLTEEQKQQYSEIARRYNITLFNAFLKVNLKVEVVTFDNSGGGTWKYYINAKLQSALSEEAVYIISIDSTNVTILNAKRQSKITSEIAETFWQNVKQDGSDIRAFDQNKQQLYFYIDKFDYTNNRAIIFVRLQTGATELNIAFGNELAQQSSYHNAELVFDFYDDFNTETLDTNKWTPNYQNTVYYEVTNSNLRITDATKSGSDYWIYDNTDTGSQIKANFTILNNMIVEWKQKMETQSSASQYGEVGLALNKADKTLEVYNPQFDDRNDTILYVVGYFAFIGTNKYTTRINIQANTYYIHRIIKDSTSYTLTVHDLNGNQILSFSATSTATISYISVAVGAIGGYPFSIMQIDYVRVYKSDDPATFTELKISTL